MTKNIVISGITKGIGKTIALKFLQSREPCNIFGFAKTIRKTENLNSPHKLHIESVNAQNSDEIKYFAKKLISSYEQTHILVNNVGIYRTGSLFKESDDQWHELFKVNLDAAYYLTKYLYPTFSKGTHIFNICSVASKEIVKDAPSYSISKMAFYGLHKAMVQELEPLGIKVTAILPGAVYTDSWKEVSDNIKDVILPAEDIANLVWYAYHLAPQSMVKEIEIKPLNF